MKLTMLNFIQAVPLPFGFALFSLMACSLLAFFGIQADQDDKLFQRTCLLLSASFFLSVACCSLADGLCRYREYLRFKRIFLRYGFRQRLLRRTSGSRCQRDAILLAARQTGYDQQLKRLFRQLGYRWYHILPDPIVDNPLNLFKPEFLRTTFLPGKRASLSKIGCGAILGKEQQVTE